MTKDRIEYLISECDISEETKRAALSSPLVELLGCILERIDHFERIEEVDRIIRLES